MGKSSPESSPQVDGISQNELCKRFGIPAKTVKRKAERRGLTVQQYLYLETGAEYRDKKYYLPLQD